MRKDGSHCWFVAALALLAASITARAALAEEFPVARIAVSASPPASYFGERIVEGVMEFRGRKYLLTFHGVGGSAASVGSVFGLRRPQDVVGPYTSTAKGWGNESGVTIRFDPPLEIRDGSLRIRLASRIYPKSSTGQGGNVE
jgi:uncharacterized protein (DUF58 family)